MEGESVPLMPYEEYQSNKVHIGTQTKSQDMQQFIHEVAADGTGLHLIDIEQTDERRGTSWSSALVNTVSVRRACSLRPSVPGTSSAVSSQALSPTPFCAHTSSRRSSS